MPTRLYLLSALACLPLVSCYQPAPPPPGGPGGLPPSSVPAAGGPATVGTPVETDIHELMERFFESAYKRLKAQMVQEPADKAAWSSIRSNALVLAEGANLLAGRRPTADDAEKIDDPESADADWNRLSGEVRDAGSVLYQAAIKKDFPACEAHYRALLVRCNACHDRFADGEYQLEP